MNESIQRHLSGLGTTTTSQPSTASLIAPSYVPVKHQHTLTKTNPTTVYPVHRNGQPTWMCDYCKRGYGVSELYHCFTCFNFDLCRFCAVESRTLTNPPAVAVQEVSVPSLHHHPLSVMNPKDIYGTSARCNKCYSEINSNIYHCSTCCDFDICSKCYNKDPVPRVNPAVTPVASSSSFGLGNNASRPIRENINVPSHTLPLKYYESPYHVYGRPEWICDVCRKPHNERNITPLFHSSSNYDLLQQRAFTMSTIASNRIRLYFKFILELNIRCIDTLRGLIDRASMAL
eukprot:gene17412-20777_t